MQQTSSARDTWCKTAREARCEPGVRRLGSCSSTAAGSSSPTHKEQRASTRHSKLGKALAIVDSGQTALEPPRAAASKALP